MFSVSPCHFALSSAARRSPKVWGAFDQCDLMVDHQVCFTDVVGSSHQLRRDICSNSGLPLAMASLRQ